MAAASAYPWIYLIATIAGWLVAQLLKYLIDAYKRGSLTNFSMLYQSGGMPSSHSAITVALLVVIGWENGVQSGLFAVALVLAVIVMYDAMQVRRSSGEQGLALQKLLKKTKDPMSLPRPALGHTPAEVTAGAIVGAITSLTVVFFMT